MESKPSPRGKKIQFPPTTAPEPTSPPEEDLEDKATAELRRRYTDLSALYTSGARLSAILQLEPLINEMLDTAMQLVNGDGGSLMLIDDHRGDLYVAAARELPSSVVSEARLQIGEGVAGWVAQHRVALLLAGSVQPERFPEFFPKPDQVDSSLCVPLLSVAAHAQPQTLLGVLNLHRKIGSNPFTQDDLELMVALSGQAAAALTNARLYHQMARRATQLQNLIDISRSLTASLNIDVVLRSIMEKAVKLLLSEAGSLLLVDDETHELIFKVALGPAGAKLSDTRLPPGVGIAGAVARDGRPLIINDAKADPRHYTEIDASTALTTQSILCVPLVSKSRIIGVLEVMNKTDGTPFEEEDCNSLTAFAIESAIALENARLYSDLKRAFTDTVRVIANAVEARDPYTAGHTGRVTQIAIATAVELGWTEEQVELLEIGALLHDIGKIGVEDAILRKPGNLTDEEYTEMKQHPLVGARMLEGVSVLRPILPFILYHQERYDGKGYPFGLAGKEIPIEGRMLAVVDTFDALTSDRPYRKGMSAEEAIAEIARNRGTQFDPDVVDALLRVFASGKA